jgi:hypothetical protein
LFQGAMIPFDTVVQMFTINMPDGVFGAAAAVHFTNDFSIVMRLVGDDGERMIAANCIAGLAHEGPCRVGISACCQAEVNKLATLINATPQVTPTAIHPDICFVNMPLQSLP